MLEVVVGMVMVMIVVVVVTVAIQVEVVVALFEMVMKREKGLARSKILDRTRISLSLVRATPLLVDKVIRSFIR